MSTRRCKQSTAQTSSSDSLFEDASPLDLLEEGRAGAAVEAEPIARHPPPPPAHKPSFSERFQSSVQSAIVGTMQTFRLGKKEVREQRRQVVYEPTHRWWEPPLTAWLPEYNREILAILFVYNALVPVLAYYTDLCGMHTALDVEIHAFCADDFIMLQDKALTGLGVGLFLLLAFRANQAYDRFWEGRKMVGRMREVCRDFTRLVCAHVQVDTEDDVLDRRRVINFVTAFGAAVKLHLRKERDIRRDIEDLGLSLSLQDIANIQTASHQALFCQDIMSDYLAKQVRAGKLSDYQMGVINHSSIAVMSDTMGSMERIANTPIPLSYVLQLRFFLILWLILYPWNVVAYYGWFTILFTDLVAHAVLGIESMACEIENPFGYDRNDLDMDAYIEGFKKDTQEILKRAEHQDKENIFDRQMVLNLSHEQFSGLDKRHLSSEDLDSETDSNRADDLTE